MKTQKQAVDYALSMIGKGYDFDGSWGWQCFDTANYYWYYLFGHGLKGDGAIDIPTKNNFKGEATVYKNTPNFLAKPGDVVVFNANYGEGYGHVAIVVSANLNTITVVEQNWNGGGRYMTEVTTKRTHAYDFPMWFIRPKFAKGKSKPSKPVKETKSNGWSKNKHNTYYKKEKATFYNGNEPIQTRIDSPKMKAPKGYKFQPNGYTPYDEVCLSDKHVWIGYNWQGKRYYLPIRKWDGVAPPKHSLGALWGVIK